MLENNPDKSRPFAVLLAAAGKSRRFADGDIVDSASKKPFIDLHGQPVWQHSAALFAADSRVRQLIVILATEDLAFFETTYSRQMEQGSLELVAGGKERFESIENGLRLVRRDIDYVAIHDAARPCVTAEQIDAVFRAAEQWDAAILAAPLVGTIKRAVVPDNTASVEIDATVPRDNLWEAQTPQVFRRDLILEAYSQRGNMRATDDAQLVENIGRPVKIVPADRTNLKITTASDLVLARTILERVKPRTECAQHQTADCKLPLTETETC
ncbi:MAG: 2-C-methyl-D-erythritol 4-phosphate cytidylyltransferase [Planctomycetaceae bacterium]|nr:2-C-methyl-D-erythritol 4-phosphate cytidylyltransferase [Planctomycetaceae bacterium]